MFPKYVVVVTLWYPPCPQKLGYGTVLETRGAATLAEANAIGQERVSYNRQAQSIGSQFGEGIQTVQYAIYEQSAPVAATK